MATRTRLHSGAAVLWGSAFVITGMIIMQAGRFSQNAAFAEMANTAAGYTLLTTDAGGGDVPPDEILYVIDSRDETILLYEIENAQKKTISLRQAGSLSNLFRNAAR
jgi:hypothetical protein